MKTLALYECEHVAGGTAEQAEDIGEVMAGAATVAAFIPGGQGVAIALYAGAAAWELGAAIGQMF